MTKTRRFWVKEDSTVQKSFPTEISVSIVARIFAISSCENINNSGKYSFFSMFTLYGTRFAIYSGSPIPENDIPGKSAAVFIKNKFRKSGKNCFCFFQLQNYFWYDFAVS